MNNRENEEFTAYLRSSVREAERLKYYPNYFKNMLNELGGFETVKRILATGQLSEGFKALWERNRVDLTCEAIIVEQKWRPYFDEDLLILAEKTLRSVGYTFKRFETPAVERSPVAAVLAFEDDGLGSVTGESSTTLASPLEADLLDILRTEDSATTRSALIAARLGQGKFRRELLVQWNGACAVTGCGVSAVLRASHCKPWRESDNRERLDADNGLVLSANLDALFDSGLVSFDENGSMLLSSALSVEERLELGLPANLRRPPTSKQDKYLAFHRTRVFQR